MSIVTEALVTVTFNHETFDSEAAVREYIEDKKEEIKRAEETLRNLAFMTEPKKWCDEEETPTGYIQRELDYAIETLRISSVQLSNAYAVLHGWKYMHHENGGAYISDKNSRDVTLDELQRIDGDYICMVNPDGSNAYPDDEVNTSMYDNMIKSYQNRLKYEAEHREWLNKLKEND